MPSPHNPHESNGDQFEPGHDRSHSLDPAAGGRAHLPEPTTLLKEQFAAFAAAHGLTLLGPSETAAAWRPIERKVGEIIFGEEHPEMTRGMQLLALDGATATDGERVILLAVRDQDSGRFFLPLPVSPSQRDDAANPRMFRWAHYQHHGAALIAMFPPPNPEGEILQVGFDYVLSPPALQLDQDRFIARGSGSVIEAAILKHGRSHRDDLPDVASISRWSPSGTDLTVFRVTETDGTKHLVLSSSDDPGTPSGVHTIETIPATPEPLLFPNLERFAGKVGLYFDQFHRARGFESVAPEKVLGACPSLLPTVAEYLQMNFAGYGPEWQIGLERVMQQAHLCVALMSLSDGSLDSFIPSSTPESILRDRNFSGLMMTITAENLPSERVRSNRILRFLNGALRKLGALPEPALKLNIVGPVLSCEAWQEHLGRLSTDPQRSIFFPGIIGAVTADIERHHGELDALAIRSIRPLRISSDGELDTVVIAVEHTFGIHITELARARTFGFIPSLRPLIQQYSPNPKVRKQ